MNERTDTHTHTHPHTHTHRERERETYARAQVERKSEREKISKSAEKERVKGRDQSSKIGDGTPVAAVAQRHAYINLTNKQATRKESKKETLER